jgi:hypothetical protein
MIQLEITVWQSTNDMIDLLPSHHGGFAVGGSVFGRGVWIQREPHCHRWRVWRMRPSDVPACEGPRGDDDMGAGDREPRRPRPGAGGAQIALDPRSPD